MDKPHKKLDVWKLSMELAGTVYRTTSAFPADEKFGLVAQMRRATVSVPSNLAEGAARTSSNEFRQCLSIARGSLSELDTQLDLCRDLNLIGEPSRQKLDDMMLRVDKMLYALHRSKSRTVA
jgi:four helix bundle protein